MDFSFVSLQYFSTVSTDICFLPSCVVFTDVGIVGQGGQHKVPLDDAVGY